MDGNSTISLGQFLSTHSGALLSIAQLGTAIVLAYFTIKLYRATAKYADLVELQNGIMEEQNKKVQSQNDIMETQNDIMETQNGLMIRTWDYNLLVKKYNRMLDEMNNLVAPLYANKDDPDIFISYNEENLLIQMELRQNANNTFNTFQMGFSETYGFWKNIYKYLYLSQSDDLTKDLMIYMKCIETYRRCVSSENREAQKLLAKNSTDTKLYKAENITYNLKEIINTRYNELAKQINDVQDELRISEYSQRAPNPNHEDG